jgi:hypothetical protein
MAKQTFTTGQVLTAAQMTSLQQTAMGGGSTTAKTTSYVLTAADAGTVVQMNAAGATTITVNTALFAAGDTVQIQNIGAGVCTITAGTATVSTAGSLALSQYEGGQLYFNSTSAALFFDIVQSASASALTLIKARTTFTSAADTGTTFDNIFSNTYRTYLIVIDQFSSASAADAQLQLLYSGTTQNTAAYYNAHQYITWGGAATIVNATAATVNNLGGMSAGANISNFTVKMYSPQASSTNWKWTWDGYSPTWQGVGLGGAFVNASQTYTGIKLSASAGNITGAITVYGLATS